MTSSSTGPSIGLSPAPDEREKWHRLLPGAAWARVFYPPGKGLPDFGHPVMAWYANRGVTVHASAKDPGTAEQLRAEFDSIPDGVTYKRTYHHEPQGDGLDPAVYADQWRLLRQVRDDHPARDRILLVEAHNLWAARYRRDDWRIFHTPYADRIGWDVYWPEVLPYEHPASTLGLPIRSLTEVGMLDWELTELGASHTRLGRARWLVDVVDLAAVYGCKAVGLWCSARVADGKLYDYRPVPIERGVWRQLLDRNAEVR